MKINVAVLFGGKSVEHEVSVISALQAMQNMNKDKYQLYPVYITKKTSFITVNILIKSMNIRIFRNCWKKAQK